LTGKHQGLEAEKLSSQEDAGCGSSEEVEELELEYCQSHFITVPVGEQQGI